MITMRFLRPERMSKSPDFPRETVAVSSGTVGEQLARAMAAMSPLPCHGTSATEGVSPLKCADRWKKARETRLRFDIPCEVRESKVRLYVA